MQGFTPEEQQLMDKLRDKYAGHRAEQEEEDSCIGTDSTAQSQIVPATSQKGTAGVATRATSNVDASVCSACQGTGTLVEIYNHRRLENYCQSCDGRGVRVFRNGVEVKEGDGSAAREAAAAAALTSGAARGAAGIVAMQSKQQQANGYGKLPEDGGEEVGDRAAALQKDLQRLADKAAAYTKERLDALALLRTPSASAADCADPAGREAAVQALLAQLEVQLEKLELARRRKAAALGRLPRATNGAIDDAVVNEGVRA